MHKCRLPEQLNAMLKAAPEPESMSCTPSAAVLAQQPQQPPNPPPQPPRNPEMMDDASSDDK